MFLQVHPSPVSPWCPILAGGELLWRSAIRVFTQVRGGLEFFRYVFQTTMSDLDGKARCFLEFAGLY